MGHWRREKFGQSAASLQRLVLFRGDVCRHHNLHIVSDTFDSNLDFELMILLIILQFASICHSGLIIPVDNVGFPIQVPYRTAAGLQLLGHWCNAVLFAVPISWATRR